MANSRHTARFASTWLVAGLVLAFPSYSLAAGEEQEQPRIRILLTFDDGPANPTIFGSPTERVLDILRDEGIAAAFFVLTTPDRFFLRRIPKAETTAGFAILKREIAEGHVVGVHWGGDYRSQWRRHPSRVWRSPYDSSGDGLPDRVTDAGCALESDLLQAIARIKQAANEVGVDFAPRYVRPPFWQYRGLFADARPTYAALGLKMVLADGRFRDTGYAIHPMSSSLLLLLAIDRALRRDETTIVLALHDSNHWTALKLPHVIRAIRSHMQRKGLIEGRHWCFPTNRDEVERILQERE